MKTSENLGKPPKFPGSPEKFENISKTSENFGKHLKSIVEPRRVCQGNVAAGGAPVFKIMKMFTSTRKCQTEIARKKKAGAGPMHSGRCHPLY